MSQKTNSPPSLERNLYHTPKNKTPLGALVAEKRTVVQGLDIPRATRPRLSRAGVVCHSLQTQPLYSSEYSQEISVYDKINRGEVQQVPNYVTDIYQRLYYAEVSCTDQARLTSIDLLHLLLTF